MKKILLSVFFVFFLLHGFSQVVTVSDSVYFNSNDTNLTELSSSTLRNFKNKIYGRKLISLTITGNADNAGSNIYNFKLALKRAGKIKDWLQNEMPEENAIANAKLISSGETNPVNDNSTEEFKAFNRRVYINIVVDYTPYLTIQKLNEEVNPPAQSFCIDNTRDTMLICRQGTMVYIKANSINKKKCTSSCITIQIKEALYKNDILKNNLTTNSDDKILISQSMVYVNAVCDEQQLSLIPGGDYVIFSPADKINDLNGAGVFDGVMDTVGNVNWKGINSQVTEINAKDLINCDGNKMRCGKGDEISCDTCRLIFCGISRLIKFSFEENGEIKKKEYKSCRKNAMLGRKAARKSKKDEAELKRLQQLQLAQRNIKVPCYYDAVGPCGGIVSKFDINCAINFEKEIAASMDSMLKNGNPVNINTIDELQYAVLSRTAMGWSNVDWILKVPDYNKKDIRIDLEATPYTDARIVFKNHKTILRAVEGKGGRFVFPGIPSNEAAVLLIIDTRTGKDKILVQKIEIITGGIIIEPKFTLMSISEYLKVLDTFK